MAEVFDLKALVSADVSPFEKAMDSSANSVSSSLSLINTAANAYIGSGFIRTLIKATNTAYEFEQVMADISSISSVNTDKMASSIRGLDNVYGKLSAVANSVYEIISSGFDKSSDEVLHFQKTISATAKTIRADIDATTNAMTTLANAYGIPIDQVQKISDMLFVTVREGKAQGNELARTLGLVTNTAAEAGVTLAEMAATISILSRTQSSSQSMIGFNQMLNSLIKPTQEAQREAKKWGIEIGAAALQSKGFTAILTELHDKIGGNVEAINAILGNIRAMRAGTALTGRQFENFIKVLREAEKEIGSGASLEAFAKQTDTAQQSLKNFEVQFDKTMEGVGKDFEPISKNLIELSERMLKNFSDTNPISQWSNYITAAYLTMKTLNAVVDSVKAGFVAMQQATATMVGNTAAISANMKALRRKSNLNSAVFSHADMMTAPDRDRVLAARLRPSPSMLKAQAEANIAQMYHKNPRGRWYDPSTGMFINRNAAVSAEILRLQEVYRHEREVVVPAMRREQVAARYNSIRGTNYTSDIIFNHPTRRKFGAFGKAIASGLSKTANALATVPAAISAWTVGWDIGKTIGEHFKLADSELFKFIGKLKVWNYIPGFGNLNLDGRKDPSAVEDDLIKKNRDINSKLLMRLKREGKLSETAYQLELQQVALAKTLKDLTDQYSRLIKDIKPKTPKAQSHVDIENEAKTNAEQILSSKPLTEAQRTEIIKSVKAHTKPLEQATKSQKFRTITGEKDLLAGLITEQDLLALASVKNVNEIEKMTTDLINRADNMTYSPTAYFQMRLGTESTKDYITNIKTEYRLALRRIIQKIAYDVRAITFVDDAERVKLRKALVNESMESAANKDATRAGNEYDKHIKAAEVTDAERRATSDYRYAYRYRGIDTYGLNAATASSTTAMLNQDKAFEEKLDAYLELKASGDLLIGGKRVGDTDKWKGKLVTSYNALMAEEKKLKEAINASVDGSLSYIRDVLEAITSEGLAEDSAEYARRSTVEIQREISRLQDLANRSTTDYGKRKIRSAIATHKKTLNDIVDKQTTKISEMYKGIFGSMHDSLTQYNKDMTHLEVGRMTNNQLFHNLNMMSRITGPSLIQRGLIPVTARNNVRYRDTQSRVKAEQQVFSAIDSYIMSKKYEDANIGKTVTNIYDYIRDNNKIMVSR